MYKKEHIYVQYTNSCSRRQIIEYREFFTKKSQKISVILYKTILFKYLKCTIWFSRTIKVKRVALKSQPFFKMADGIAAFGDTIKGMNAARSRNRSAFRIIFENEIVLSNFSLKIRCMFFCQNVIE